MSAHHTPEEIRKGLTHAVIDSDGHWVEYTPVFAEQIRKVTGDLGANGFLQSQRRIPDSLSMTLEQRTERGVAMEGFWGRQSTNTRDRATAMMPRMLYDRLGELGIDFGIVYPTAGARRAAASPAADAPPYSLPDPDAAPAAPRHSAARCLPAAGAPGPSPDRRCACRGGGGGGGVQLF